MEQSYFYDDEKVLVRTMVKSLIGKLNESLNNGDVNHVHAIIKQGILANHYSRDQYGINPTVRNLRTALLVADNIAPDRSMVIATLLYNLVRNNSIKEEEVVAKFGEDVAKITRGLIKVSQLYQRQAAVRNENFQKLLLTFADDIRVIIIMIVDRLGLMREINHHPNEQFVHDIAAESRYLYAPLAHRLGLYQIKSELEDMSLKYLNRKVYSQIAEKLSETKARRDAYVVDFIDPIKKALAESGLNFEIKGRTKSINSIWNKMKKKDVDLNGMYDLFAIRIIIDTEREKEKKECWIAYSIVTDIYTANPSRHKDWITIPKSNGYESLHITVKGPEDKWVEVQIRTKRMDEIAERGLAAHWKYKGIKSEGDLDSWMNNVREVLEAGSIGQMELVRGMNMNLYEKEVFVFTPKGDLFQLPMGSTILDFAFAIHTRVGCTCTGGRVDGKNQKINYKLKSGDTVEITTMSTQTPRQDWLNIAVTSKARNKIRQAVNEARVRQADMARELVQRRFKNRKIDLDEGTMAKLTKKLGYKTITDFYVDINEGHLDVNTVAEKYEQLVGRLTEGNANAPHGTAEGFVLQPVKDEVPSDDILVIGNNVKGINYKLSKCCNPILGDKIAGFIASDGAIKIHKLECGNLKHLVAKYPYRLIKSAWSGKVGTQFAVTIKVVGKDDIGIVSNITSVINKNADTVLRNISISSQQGTFEGFLVVGIPGNDALDELMKKILALKGVKHVERVNR
ncbi:MAG: bifunctional (p)ppGpp synthetase/guanosine-3',5'-bis(diphosphate) 3'-pyrophosphohydrolase [Bacteroidales bacterium]|nr:bifunctional (p)ppGpp synthetase/guanosine-3',5'-bis(diphosphate) 3'-pyrophosphohydrolase [Candidatus Sodaliphilus limicaballi]